MSPSILAISYFFHLLATIAWVGGLVILALLVVPEARRIFGEQPALETFLMRLRKRFLPISHFSLILLIATGLVQMAGDPNYDGMLQFTNDWSRAILLKHIAIIGMLVCGLALQFSVIPSLERARLLLDRGKGDPNEWAKLRRSEARLTWINVVLGVLVLGFTAWATAI